MIYVKKKLMEDMTANIELTEDDEYYTRCTGVRTRGKSHRGKY